MSLEYLQPFVMARLGLSVSNFVCCYYFCATLAFDDINIYIYMLCLKVCVICYKILVCFFFFTNFVEQSEILMADLNKILVLKHRW